MDNIDSEVRGWAVAVAVVGDKPIMAIVPGLRFLFAQFTF
jgi:hypothetical protein